MKRILINIQIPSRKLFAQLINITGINFSLLIGTLLCNSLELDNRHYLIGFFLRESNLAWENTIATWYSSMLLLVIAILSIVCFITDKQNHSKRYDNFISYGWLVIALIFSILSLDEIGSIHESLGNTRFFNSLGIREALLSNAFYGIIICIAFFMAVFGYLRFRNNKKAMIFGVLGVALFLTVPLQERLEWSSVVWHPNTGNYYRSPYSIILEEGTEIFGSLSFIICLFQYLIIQNKPKKINNQSLNIHFAVDTKKALFKVIIATSFLLLLNFIIQYVFSGTKKSDNGIIENWFPSAAAFITFLFGFFLYFENKKATGIKQKGLLFFNFLAFGISAYFGSNLINRVLEKGSNFSLLLNSLLLTIVLLTALYLIVKNKMFFTRIGLCIWSLFFFLILFLKYESTANLGFFSFAFLNLFFFIDLSRKKMLLPH